MKIAVFYKNDEAQVGVVTSDQIVPVGQSLKDVLLLDAGTLKQRVEQQTDQAVPLNEVRAFGPCVPGDAKIICVGLNYRKHAEEAGMPIPEYPILFNKFSNALAGHQQEVVLPKVAKENDYEAELGIVIGKRTKHVTREDALAHVFGYCNVNDVSARDLQMRTTQWMLGKSLDGYCPAGPYLVTSDEVGNPNDLGIKLYLNGELRQNSNTADMIFKVDEIISYVSSYITLEPGDLIITGTPEGVIAGYPEAQRVWLKHGDRVTVAIDKLGELTNTFKEE